MDILFLAKRCQNAGSFSSSEDRDHGISSNSLVSLAYGVSSLEMPSDWWDYAACVRAARHLPRHRRTRTILAALAIQKTHVRSRYPTDHRKVRPKTLTDFVSR